MAYRVRGRGQFTAGESRSGRGYNYGGRSVRVQGENFQLTWNGPGFEDYIIATITNALSQLSDEALAFMIGIVPVDTGALQASCYVRLDITNGRLRLLIGAGTPYAVYVELGSSRNASQPYIRPTFDFVLRRLPVILRNEAQRRGR